MRPRLLPAVLAAMALLLAAKLQGIAFRPPGGGLALVAPARANSEPAAASRAATPTPARPLQPLPPEPPSAEQQAERALLEGLRARRTEIDAREQALASREMVLSAAEKRLALRIEELTALQQRLQAFDRTLSEREGRRLAATGQAL